MMEDFFRRPFGFTRWPGMSRMMSEVQSDKAKASFKDGVLEIKIPKSEAAKKKQKKIKIE
jgi:HSP20 family protein